MHWQPDILPVAPDVIGETDRHRRGAGRGLARGSCAASQSCRGSQEPDLSAVTAAVPGETPGATRQGRNQASQRAIPPFHEGRLDRLIELAQA
jgi:hypothetical protein